MPKLSVTLSVSFTTGSLFSHNGKTFKTDEIKAKKLLKVFSEADPEKFGFELVTSNEGSQISFGFDRSNGKKGSMLALNPKADSTGLEVRIEGQFDLKLRAGVAPLLQKYGDKLDLRLRAATYNGGEWNGFSSYLQVYDRDKDFHTQYTNLPQITTFAIK